MLRSFLTMHTMYYVMCTEYYVDLRADDSPIVRLNFHARSASLSDKSTQVVRHGVPQRKHRLWRRVAAIIIEL